MFRLFGKFRFRSLFLRLTSSSILLLVSYLAAISALYAWISIITTPYGGTYASSMGYSFEISLSFDDGHTFKEYSGNDICQFDDVFCGKANSKSILISCKNTSQQSLRFSWFFRMPEGREEVPYVEAGLYYYLGSQLQISQITSMQDSQSVSIFGEGNYLVETSSAGLGFGQVTAVDSMIGGFSKISLLDVVLPSGISDTLSLCITFVDNGQNQSVYQSFLGSCSRRLSVSIATC